MIHWFIGSLAHWLIGSLAHWLIGSLAHRPIDFVPTNAFSPIAHSDNFEDRYTQKLEWENIKKKCHMVSVRTAHHRGALMKTAGPSIGSLVGRLTFA